MIQMQVIRILVCTIALFNCLSGYSQSYSGKASLSKISQDDFYSIVLTPEITSQLLQSNADIRIINSKGVEVPYIYENETAVYRSTAFIEYPVVEKKIVPNRFTSIIVENAAKKAINNICIEVRNSDAFKLSEILGSDDKKEWFGIRSTYTFQNNNSDNSTTSYNVIGFPLSDYRYFKIQFSDSNLAPLNIIRAGYFDSKVEQGKFSQIPSPVVIQKDSADHMSYAKLNCKVANRIDRLEFAIDGPRYYVRHAELALLVSGKHHKKHFETVVSFDLKSNSPHAIDLPATIQEKELYLLVKNDNNPPLKIRSVKAFQLTQYLKAYLNKNEDYSLLFGNKDAQMPVYDLQYFTDSIAGVLPNVKIGEIVNSKAITNQVHTAKWYENTILIWTVLLVVLTFMAYMVFSMMKDIGKGDK
jgi:hypothetical protein